MLRAAAASLLSLVYPHQCRVCRDLVDAPCSSTLCERCWADGRLFSGLEMLCFKCGALLGDLAPPEPFTCPKCGDLAFDSAASLGVYGGALSAAVIELKKTPFLDRRVCNLLAESEALRRVSFNSDLIIPVPLSKIRRAERGFNQAEVIANEIGRITGIAVDSLSLVRTRHTPMHRIGMDSRARQIASLKSFAVKRDQLLRGRRVLLVDDVLTSGATASACAAALKKSGSGEVNVFTIARAVMH